MKRLHVHVSVEDLAASTRFYSTLFGRAPTMTRSNYAKWQLDDPRVNFAISNGRTKVGLNHLGIQTDSDEELDNLRAQMNEAEIAGLAESNVACCYHRSNKYWVTDPTGIAWETFHTLGEVPVYGESTRLQSGAACCSADAKAPARADATSNAAVCCSQE